MTTRQTPHKQTVERPVRHLLTIQPEALEYCCQCIARAISDIWDRGKRNRMRFFRPNRVCLYVDDDLRAYLICDNHQNFDAWMSAHRDWWVGTYTGSTAYTDEETGRKRLKSRAALVSDLTTAIKEDVKAGS